MKFDYTAVNRQSKTVNGEIEAADKEAVGQLLAKQGYKPLLIKEQPVRSFAYVPCH